MTDTPSRRPGLRDELINALGQITTTPPVAHRREQADNVLAVLYREWPWLRAEAEDDPPLRDQLRAAITALGKSETELAALRKVARGYCPTCGRGDCAPTVADWEQQKQRVEQVERDCDTARQHAAAIAAQRDRLRQRMNTLADRWDHALAPDKPYARTLRNEISCAPFDPEGAMTVREYTERGRRLWAFRCWGTDTCDGWLGLGHHTQTSALAERERHVIEAHVEPRACSCPASVLLAEVLGQFQPLRPESDPTGEPGHWQCRVLPYEWDDWQKAAAAGSAAWTPPPPGDTREQLPDHLLALIRIPPYTSTACEAAELLAREMPKYTHRRIELGDHSDRLHERCRRNNKFTGVLCHCPCHGKPAADPTATQAPDEPRE